MIRAALVLLPTDESLGSALGAYATSAFGQYACTALTGQNSLPHISVIHLENTAPDAAKNLLGNFVGQELELTFSYFYLSPWGGQKYSAGFGTFYSAPLNTLHLTALEVTKGAGITPVNQHGVNFWPHLTAAVFTTESVTPIPPAPTEFFNKPLRFITRLVTGGPGWSATAVIE